MGGGSARLFFFVVCVWYRIAMSVCCLKSGGFESSRNPEHPLSLHMLKSRGSLGQGSSMAAWAGRNSQVPPAAPGGSQSHLASPACGWVRACLVRVVLPLPTRVSVCQCVSDASAETKPNTCREANMWAPSASAQPSGARFVKLPACLARHGELHTACPILH